MLSSARRWFAARLHGDAGAFSLAIPMSAGALGFPVVFAEKVDGRLAPPFIFVFGLLFGAYAGALGTVLQAGTMQLGGRVVGGRGRFVDLRAAAGLSWMPILVAEVFKLVSLPLLGSPVLEIPALLHPEGVAGRLLEIALAIFEIGCCLVAIVLTYTFAGVAQGFSALRALLGHVVGICIVALPIVIVALLYTWLMA